MVEYRTRPITRALLLAELEAARHSMENAGVREVAVCLGWNSNLPIEEMWKEQIVMVKDVSSFVADCENSGLGIVGQSDIFVSCPGFMFTLCHEGDAHVKGTSSLVQRFFARWQSLGYSPYEAQPRA